MSLKFIDERLILAACGDNKEDAENAVKICSKFCSKAFTLSACIEHPEEVSTFCASTIFLARNRVFEAKKGPRAFSVKEDLQNELTAACHAGENPLMILGYIRQSQKDKHYDIEYIEDQLELSFDGGYDEVKNDCAIVFSDIELMIINRVDGQVNASSLMRAFKLKRGEAEAIANNIIKKFATIA